MKFSAGVRNVLLAGFLSVTNGETHADSAAEKVRHQLDLALEPARARANDALRHRQLQLHTDFSMFEGDWYDCMHTTLMTFNGDPASKHVIEEKACSMGKLGTVSKIAQYGQMLQFDIHLLNHCWFHDYGGKGQEPCPDDELESDPRGKGNVLVKYSFKGIGSFAIGNKIEFFSDHTYIRDKKGEWVPYHDKAKIENMDTLICQEYMDGIVCDWKINEYRTGTNVINEKGCLVPGKKGKKAKCMKGFNEKKCKKKKGTWTEDCAEMESIPNSFVYDSFGSYYLVEDTGKCDTESFCPPTEAPVAAPSSPVPVQSPTALVWGCYGGGSCKGQFACCDCKISEEKCDGTWTGGCAPICDN